MAAKTLPPVRHRFFGWGRQRDRKKRQQEISAETQQSHPLIAHA